MSSPRLQASTNVITSMVPVPANRKGNKNSAYSVFESEIPILKEISSAIFAESSLNKGCLSIIFDYWCDQKRIVQLARIPYEDSIHDRDKILCLQQKALLTIGPQSLKDFGNIRGLFGLSVLNIPIIRIKREIDVLDRAFKKAQSVDEQKGLAPKSKLGELDISFNQLFEEKFDGRMPRIYLPSFSFFEELTSAWKNNGLCTPKNYIMISDYFAYIFFRKIFSIFQSESVPITRILISISDNISEKKCPALQPVIETIKNIFDVFDLANTLDPKDRGFHFHCISILFEKIEKFKLIEMRSTLFLQLLLSLYPEIVTKQITDRGIKGIKPTFTFSHLISTNISAKLRTILNEHKNLLAQLNDQPQNYEKINEYKDTMKLIGYFLNE